MACHGHSLQTGGEEIGLSVHRWSLLIHSGRKNQAKADCQNCSMPLKTQNNNKNIGRKFVVMKDLLRHWVPIRQRIERNGGWRQSPLDEASNRQISVHNCLSLNSEFNIFFFDILIEYGRDGEWNITRIDGIYVIWNDRIINKLKTIGSRRQWRRARWSRRWWALSTNIGITAIIGLFPKIIRKFYDKKSTWKNNLLQNLTKGSTYRVQFHLWKPSSNTRNSWWQNNLNSVMTSLKKFVYWDFSSVLRAIQGHRNNTQRRVYTFFKTSRPIGN